MTLLPALRTLAVYCAPLLALASAACRDPEPLTYPAHFSVVADERAPLAGAQISAQGRFIGNTDGSGELETSLRGFDGDRVPVSLTCPDGYTASPRDSVLVLRNTTGTSSTERKTLHHALGCQSAQRDAVVLVHVSGAATRLPVKIDGAVVGQTDSLGFGHFHLRPAPGSRFEVAVDTTANLGLLPQNPQQFFQVEARDDVFVFDRDFKLNAKAKPPRKGAAPQASAPRAAPKAAPRTPSKEPKAAPKAPKAAQESDDVFRLN
jgi:hypothetical protein